MRSLPADGVSFLLGLSIPRTPYTGTYTGTYTDMPSSIHMPGSGSKSGCTAVNGYSTPDVNRFSYLNPYNDNDGYNRDKCGANIGREGERENSGSNSNSGSINIGNNGSNSGSNSNSNSDNSDNNSDNNSNGNCLSRRAGAKYMKHLKDMKPPLVLSLCRRIAALSLPPPQLASFKETDTDTDRSLVQTHISHILTKDADSNADKDEDPDVDPAQPERITNTKNSSNASSSNNNTNNNNSAKTKTKTVGVGVGVSVSAAQFLGGGGGETDATTTSKGGDLGDLGGEGGEGELEKFLCVFEEQLQQ